MKIEKISWNSDGLNIQGEIYIPSRPTASFPGLILCHGIPGKIKDPADRGYPLLAERFCQEGFGVLIFNFRGAGLSEGNFDILGWSRDLDGGLDCFLRRPEIDPTRVFLMGFSGGAAVSIYLAAQRKEIAALVSCASPAEFRDLITGKGLVDFLVHSREVGIIKDAHFPPSLEGWKDGFRTVKPLDWAKQIPPRPLLIIHGTDDEVINISQAKNLYDKVQGEAELFLIQGAGHRLRADERAMQKAMEWLSKIALRN
jgi:fermentation-respiration switch protein FrsA (DUF1100 family)